MFLPLRMHCEEGARFMEEAVEEGRPVIFSLSHLGPELHYILSGRRKCKHNCLRLPSCTAVWVRGMKSISQGLGCCSTWDDILNSFVTPTNELNVFFLCFLRSPTLRTISKVAFKSKIFQLLKLAILKNIHKLNGSFSRCHIGSQEVIARWAKPLSLRTRPYPSYTENFSGWSCENA